MKAEFVKTLDVHVPPSMNKGEPDITMELYQDPRTGRFFALQADFLEDNPGWSIPSPYSSSPSLKLEVG